MAAMAVGCVGCPRRGGSTGQSRIVIQCLWFGEEEENGRLEEKREKRGVIHWYREERKMVAKYSIAGSRLLRDKQQQNELSRNHVPTIILLSLP